MNNEISLGAIERYMQKCKQQNGKLLYNGYWHKIRHGDRVDYIISKGIEIPIAFGV